MISKLLPDGSTPKNVLTGVPVALPGRLSRLAFIGSPHQLLDGKLFAVELETAHHVMLAVNPDFTINNRQVALELVRKGFGAALMISVSTSDDLDNGRLARLSDEYGFGYVVVSVVMRDRLPSRAAVAMQEFLLSSGQAMKG